MSPTCPQSPTDLINCDKLWDNAFKDFNFTGGQSSIIITKSWFRFLQILY